MKKILINDLIFLSIPVMFTVSAILGGPKTIVYVGLMAWAAFFVYWNVKAYRGLNSPDGVIMQQLQERMDLYEGKLLSLYGSNDGMPFGKIIKQSVELLHSMMDRLYVFHGLKETPEGIVQKVKNAEQEFYHHLDTMIALMEVYDYISRPNEEMNAVHIQYKKAKAIRDALDTLIQKMVLITQDSLSTGIQQSQEELNGIILALDEVMKDK